MADLTHLPHSALASTPAAPAPEELAAGSVSPDSAPWPVPSHMLAADLAWAGGEHCQIQGMNGATMGVRLLSFDVEQRQVRVQAAAARAPMTLRFAQFRRLALAGTASLTPARPAPAAPYRLALLGGNALTGLRVGAVSTDLGVFVYEPVNPDQPGATRGAVAVTRVFVPREILAPDAEADLLVEPATEAVDPDTLRRQRLTEWLARPQIATSEELEAAVEKQARMPMMRMGEALVALGFVSEEQLREALAAQREDRSKPLGELLVERGYLAREDLRTALARKMGYPEVNVSKFEPMTDALAKVPYSQASRLKALPLMFLNGRMVVAMANAVDVKAIDELEFAAGCKIVPTLADPERLPAALDAAYQKMGAEVVQMTLSGDAEGGDAIELLASLEMGATAPDAGGDDDGQIEQSDNQLVRLINSMILEAQSQGVSDIHIESRPGKDKVQIRFRRDGMLRPYLELPHTYRSAIIARLKIMCDLDISERRKPQDGKIAFGKFVAGSRLELRVATIPTANGLEDCVMRLLASAKPLPLDDIGLSPDNLRRIKEMAARPYGMFLCVGPTGSGKTTTLHSALGYINTPERKIWTAEDPVEITQPGLRQVQVNPKIEWTFARALRAFLRADPDVIMVGEIRDHETAEVAVESSLTGHLVLSTLHTNSAPETITRLLDMGMDPFNFADALLGVLAQRLIRRVCKECKETREATAEEIDELAADYLGAFGGADFAPPKDDLLASWKQRFGTDGKLMHVHGKGCDKCSNTGMRGRVALHELMEVTRPLRALIQTGKRVDDLQRQGLADGMRTLRQDGIEKVLMGLTTIGEVRASSNSN